MISIILPSVRPQNIISCTNAILNAAKGVDFEIIYVVDFKINFDDELYFKHRCVLAPERRGVVDALNKGIEVAQGDYLFTLSDEALLGENALACLTLMCKAHDNKVLLTPAHTPTYPFYYYGIYFAPFPFAHRSLIDEVGGFFDPVYKSFYADPDLSLRVHTHGYPIKVCHAARIHHPNNMTCEAHQHNVKEYIERDRAIFKQRWAHLGEFRDP